MDSNNNLTPEKIVNLIGNIANRPDLREVQERQVREIKILLEKYELALNYARLALKNLGEYYAGRESTEHVLRVIDGYLENK